MRMRCVSTMLAVSCGMLFAFTLVGVEAGCGGGSAHMRPPNLPVVDHVFVLVDENHSYSDVIGNPAMPYTNSLAQKYSLATNYYANTHPSLPNYFMLTTGQLVTSTDDYNGTITSDNVAHAVTAAGKTWKIYAEALPNIGYLGPTIVPYDKSHDPFAFFSEVLNGSSQAANIVPFSQLATDIQNNTLPNYAMVVPNMMNDGHDCPNEAAQCSDAQKLAQADNWLKTNIDPLINSSVFANGVLIYTWDESEISDNANGGGHVATILIGAHVRQGYRSTTLYQHQSTLRISMELLNVSDVPGAASNAPDMSEFFK